MGAVAHWNIVLIVAAGIGEWMRHGWVTSIARLLEWGALRDRPWVVGDEV